MRTTIRDLVRRIAPCDELERAQQAQTLAWIESGAPLCRIEKPATPPQHLVSYVALIDVARERLLLAEHIKAGLWLPVGGHVEPGEHPHASARRELAEELRLAPDLIRPEPLFLTVARTVGSTAGHTDVSLWYVADGDSSHEPWFDPAEFTALRWFDLAALPLERSDLHLGRFAAKLRACLEPAVAR